MFDMHSVSILFGFSLCYLCCLRFMCSLWGL